ncbi:MAG TPA: hypothetical protein DDX89_03960 [Candidatus Omnitrophica bacterium]|nr:MAG: hypothetical protein A2Z92_06845 [Omnitrophica WOR_2 bacterium GWA2_63_20]OGX16919.1 MAG: hypothetical protein A2105_00995 [Omnitrophica WOR_2 bacterium GWF2_63_9]OGX34719.1 MAG: hypothetical protein A3B73_00040 [Omnitrophica WOR_2 bacterium RIFCSPHIGHO2_02_FULL_63_39]OGX44307.1 MAG: hypothetical protein A3I71_00835 [Omnitrophica WOR_2 bacterium RIFCSPLOWO2_02_FULL_63_16]OGX47469.1 MAG: hypothetical protein A3G88_00325 [Omnitrophica WOR_2 bacterium RIFCSPLOWO2_12_FULL_63_16]HAM41058.1 
MLTRWNGWALIVLLGIAPTLALAKDEGPRTGRSPLSSKPTQAKTTTPWKGSYWTREVGQGTRVKAKFAFGLTNVVFGWTKLVTEPWEAFRRKQSIGRGVAEGVWNAIGDTVGGAVHLVTFPVTRIDVPLPEGGIPVEITRPRPQRR